MKKLITWYEQKEKGVYVIKKFMLITYIYIYKYIYIYIYILLYPKKIVNVIILLLDFFFF